VNERCFYKTKNDAIIIEDFRRANILSFVKLNILSFVKLVLELYMTLKIIEGFKIANILLHERIELQIKNVLY